MSNVPPFLCTTDFLKTLEINKFDDINRKEIMCRLMHLITMGILKEISRKFQPLCLYICLFPVSVDNYIETRLMHKDIHRFYLMEGYKCV